MKSDVSGDGAKLSPEALAAALARVAGGDRAALEAVYRATSSKLLAVCLRILHDRSESEDVLQDVYITVWRRAGAFDPARGGAIAWLSAVARNRAIDRLRARRPTDGATQVETLELPDNAPSPLLSLQMADEEARLYACLDALEGPARQVIRTAFIEGVTYEALAHRMSTPLGTVKSWVRRGLLKLRACLDT
jgi:RNA polymerase sigma-70 factor (ECF subfamily)